MTKIQKLKRVVVKEELVALTGKVDQAIVLNQFIYWSERVKDVDKYLKEEADRVRKFSDGTVESPDDRLEDLTNGWIYKTAAEMKDECMFEKSATTMERIISSLVDNGWLDRRRNPKYKWDKTYQYRVNILEIQKDLFKLGYSLEGYTLGMIPQWEVADTNLQNADSNIQIEDSRLQNADSYLQNEGAIPEITTEITLEIKNNIYLSIKEKIETINLPLSIKSILQKQIDRLIEFKINVQDIELHFHAVKDVYALNEYTYILNAFLSNMEQSPNDIGSVLNNWLKRNREKQNEVAEKKAVLKPIREEIKPDWFGKDNQTVEPEEIDENLTGKAAALQAKLKSKYGKDQYA